MQGKKLRVTVGSGLLAALIVGLSYTGNVLAQEARPAQVREPLKTCKDVTAFQERKKEAFDKLKEANSKGIPLTWNQDTLTNKFSRYENAACGEDGYPHLVVDGRLNHAGDFVIPGILFLYIAGALGWAGRSYLAQSKGAEDEILIDLPKAIKCLALSFIWPLQAIPELISGKIRESEERVTVSPR